MAYIHREPIQLMPAEAGWRVWYAGPNSDDYFIAEIVCWAVVLETSEKWDSSEHAMMGMIQWEGRMVPAAYFLDSRSYDWCMIEYRSPREADPDSGTIRAEQDRLREWRDREISTAQTKTRDYAKDRPHIGNQKLIDWAESQSVEPRYAFQTLLALGYTRVPDRTGSWTGGSLVLEDDPIM